MAFTNVPYEVRASDLIVDEYEEGYVKDNINITPAGVVTLGTVVFRAKSNDPTAPFATGLAAGDLVSTNEFAVVYGDHYCFNASFTPKAIAAGKWNGVAIRRGPTQLKEFYIKQVHAALNATQFASLKDLLADQGVIVLDDINA